MDPSNRNISSSKDSTGSSSDQRNTSTRTNTSKSGSDSSRSSYHLDMHGDIVNVGGPGFCQIIHNYLVQHGEIWIPQGFVREYGDEFSDHAVLTVVPSGIECSVEMKRDSNSDDGGVYFKNGLKEFFESYSITSGNFLAFTYEGNSHFNVLIFQMSGEEIDYSAFNNHAKETSSRSTDTIEQQDHTDIDVDDEDDYYVEASDEDDEDSDDSEDDSDNEEIRVDITRKMDRSITPAGLRTQERAIEVQRGFKSSNNYPFFTIGLQPSYVTHKYLPIPSKFEGKEVLRKLEHIRLKVVSNYGPSWIVYLSTWGQGRGIIRFSKGVPQFLKDNNLKEGDICVFELVTKKKSCSARVRIIRS